MQIKSILLAAALAAGVPTLTFAEAADTGAKPENGDRPKTDGGKGETDRSKRDGDNGNRGGGDRGNMDPAQREQHMMDFMKTQIGAQDDEWKVIEPKLKKVMSDQRDLRASGGSMGRTSGRRGPGGDNGPGPQPPQPEPTTPVAKAAADLQSSVKAGGADEAIDKKLTAYREAREKAKTDMAGDQKELKEVLTAKQEASLVLMGLLD